MSDTGTTLRGADGSLPRDVGRTERPARRSDFERNGNDQPLEIPQQVRNLMRDRLRERAGVAQDQKRDEGRLGTYDRILVGDRGEALIEKFSGNEPLTVDEAVLGWAIINDELIQKESASGQQYGQAEWLTRLTQTLDRFRSATTGSILGTVGLDRVLNAGARRIFAVASSDRVSRITGRGGRMEGRVSDTPELTSDYLDRINFSEWDPDRAAADIIQLHQMQVALEQSLGFRDVIPGGRQPDFQRGNGHRLQGEVARRQDAILRREHEGASFAELQRTDPVAAERVRHQALQEGMMHVADRLAQGVLLDERPTVDVNAIDAAIKQIGTPLKEGSPEWDDATADLDRAKARVKSTRERFEQIEDSRESLEQAVSDARTARILAANAAATQVPILDTEIADLTARIALIVGGSAAEVTRRNELTVERRRKEAERTALLDKRAQALAALNAANAAYNRLDETDATSPTGTARPGSILFAQRARQNALAEVRAADNRLKGTPDADQLEDRRALELWRKVADPGAFARIVGARFDQGHQGEFQRSRLADTTVTNGQMVGAELIRRHIFETADLEGGYRTDAQRERARRMLSDEAIARSIIEVFRVDVTDGVPPINALLTNSATDRTALRTAEQALQTARAAGLTGALLTPYETAVTTARTTLRGSEQAVLARVLPMLGPDATNFDVTDVMRFAMQEGLQSAARGEPNLQVPGYYEAQQPERRLTAEAIVGEDMGGITLSEAGPGRGTEIVWEGQLAHLNTGPGGIFEGMGVDPLDPATAHQIDDDTALTFQIETRFSDSRGGPIGAGYPRGYAQTIVRVRPDVAFLQRLPNVAPPNLAEPILDYFYDDRGRLRTREDLLALRRVPAWIELPLPAFGAITAGPATPDIISGINGPLSPEASRRVNIATATDIINRPPQERARILRDFRETNVGTITLPGGVVEPLTVAMDTNGELFISSPTMGERQLTAFFDDERDDFVEDPARRAAIQGQARNIYNLIGREIMRTQARR